MDLCACFATTIDHVVPALMYYFYFTFFCFDQFDTNNESFGLKTTNVCLKGSDLKLPESDALFSENPKAHDRYQFTVIDPFEHRLDLSLNSCVIL